jgi:S-formylglutathione hydrolase
MLCRQPLIGLLALIFLAAWGRAHAQDSIQAPSRVVNCNVPAPSLSGNLLSDTAAREITVYLPPSYTGSQTRYPVVYFLTAFGDRASAIADGAYNLTLPGSLDSVILQDSLREMILVAISGRNSLGGSFYVNSPVTGNWEDFVVKDLVSYIDATYRTIPDAASRGLCGHSMGGAGALTIAMHNPGVFGALYVMSAPVVDSCGLQKTPLCSSPALIDSILLIKESLEKLAPAAARARLASILQSSGPDVALTFAYGAAFVPDTTAKFPYITYPFHRENGRVVTDSVLMRRWECGFGAIPMKLWRYRDNLMKLRQIGVECGLSDESSWIREGCGYLSIQLDVEEIPHTTTFFRGGHRNKLGERITQAMLPFFSTALSFQS